MKTVVLLSLVFQVALGQLEIVDEWPLLRFAIPESFPNRQNLRADRSFFTGIEVGWERIFLALPRVWDGNAATLAVIPRHKPGVRYEQSPALQAYPNWSWHQAVASGAAANGSCDGLISVFRIRADRCNRLWVLDSGVVNSLETFTIACPPRLLIFDMRTDELLRTISFPSEVVRRNTLLTNLVLDDITVGSAQDKGDCSNMFVYMSDTTNPGLIVYNTLQDTTWRLQNPMLFPEPSYGTYRLGDESFTLMDGVIGLALSPPGTSDRVLYFQPFASNRLYGISTSALQRGPNPGDDAELPVVLLGTKSSQAAGLAVNPRDGSVVFSPISETAIAAWIPGSPKHRVVAYNPELLQFALDLVPADRDNGIIWLLTTKFQKVWLRSISPNEMNFRILRIVEPDTYSNNSLQLYKKK